MVEFYGYEQNGCPAACNEDERAEEKPVNSQVEDVATALALSSSVGRSPPVSIKSAERPNRRHDDFQDELDESVLREMLARASPKFVEPFSVKQITRNVSIGRAARREMDVASSFGGTIADGYASAAAVAASDGARSSKSSTGGMLPAASSVASSHAGGGGSGLPSTLLPSALFPSTLLPSAQQLLLASVSSIGTFDAEIARQRAAVAVMEDDVEEESRVNLELAKRIIERLDNSCKLLEGLSSLLSSLGQAEAAYAAAMASASRVRLVGLEADDGELRAAGEALMRLPAVVEEAHRPLTTTLSNLSKEVGGLLCHYRAAAREMSSQAAAARRNIEATRQHLGAVLGDHVAACRSFEGVLAERRQRRQPTRGPDSDPWATEGRLVQEQQELQRWQDQERAALKTGFQRVMELEQQRLELSTQAMAAAFDSYRAALLPLQHELQSATSMLRAIEPDAKLGTLRDMAATATRTAEGLAARQAECLHSACHELFCSPEIVRQGDLQILEPATERWRKCHFVLTRAGYLHWFTRADDVRPLDGLSLSRCTFEDGKAPRFNILETPKGSTWLSNIRGRRVTFQAASVEECCEWAIAIREAIAVASGKQLAFDEEGGGA